jgi:hypothetical protein
MNLTNKSKILLTFSTFILYHTVSVICVDLNRALLEQWLGPNVSGPVFRLNERQINVIDPYTFGGLSTLQ